VFHNYCSAGWSTATVTGQIFGENLVLGQTVFGEKFIYEYKSRKEECDGCFGGLWATTTFSLKPNHFSPKITLPRKQLCPENSFAPKNCFALKIFCHRPPVQTVASNKKIAFQNYCRAGWSTAAVTGQIFGAKLVLGQSLSMGIGPKKKNVMFWGVTTNSSSARSRLWATTTFSLKPNHFSLKTALPRKQVCPENCFVADHLSRLLRQIKKLRFKIIVELVGVQLL
jgi:hypothetical protein